MIKLLSIDAWGNQDDGYDWNDWYTVGYLDNSCLELSEIDLVKLLISKGFLNEVALTDAYIMDDQYNLVICDRETHQPIYAIEYGNIDG